MEGKNLAVLGILGLGIGAAILANRQPAPEGQEEGNSDLELAIYDAHGMRVAGEFGALPAGNLVEGTAYTVVATLTNRSTKTVGGIATPVPATLRVRFDIGTNTGPMFVVNSVMSYNFAANEQHVFTQTFTPNLGAIVVNSPSFAIVNAGGPNSDLANAVNLLATKSLGFTVEPGQIIYGADLVLG